MPARARRSDSFPTHLMAGIIPTAEKAATANEHALMYAPNCDVVTRNPLINISGSIIVYVDDEIPLRNLTNRSGPTIGWRR